MPLSRWLTVAVFASVGCTDPSASSDPPFTVRDSAGIRIVENDSVAVRIVPVEVLRVGAVTGENPYQLDRVRSVDLLPDGSIILANAGDATLRVFDDQGRFVRSMGGEGEGPGEFVRLSRVFSVGDTVVAYSTGGGPPRLTFYGPGGAFLRVVSLTSIPAIDARFVLTSEGWTVWNQLWPSGMSEPGELVQSDARSRMFDVASGEPGAELLRLPSSKGIAGRGSIRGPPLFEPQGIVVPAKNDRIYATASESYEVRILDHRGTLGEIVRRQYSRKPVTDEHRSVYEALVQEFVYPNEVESMLLVGPRVSFFPPIDALMSAKDGGFWVRRADLKTHPVEEAFASRYYVPDGAISEVRESRNTFSWEGFAEDGRYVGTTELSTRFVPHVWGNDWVIGVLRDDLDVEFLVRYSLEREEAPLG